MSSSTPSKRRSNTFKRDRRTHRDGRSHGLWHGFSRDEIAEMNVDCVQLIPLHKHGQTVPAPDTQPARRTPRYYLNSAVLAGLM